MAEQQHQQQQLEEQREEQEAAPGKASRMDLFDDDDDDDDVDLDTDVSIASSASSSDADDDDDDDGGALSESEDDWYAAHLKETKQNSLLATAKSQQTNNGDADETTATSEDQAAHEPNKLVSFSLQEAQDGDTSKDAAAALGALSRADQLNLYRMQQTLRQHVHKMHLMCLLGNLVIRSRVCDNADVQAGVLSCCPSWALRERWTKQRVRKLCTWFAANIHATTHHHQRHEHGMHEGGLHLHPAGVSILRTMQDQRGPPWAVTCACASVLRHGGVRVRVVSALQPLSKKVPTADSVLASKTSSGRRRKRAKVLQEVIRIDSGDDDDGGGGGGGGGHTKGRDSRGRGGAARAQSSAASTDAQTRPRSTTTPTTATATTTTATSSSSSSSSLVARRQRRRRKREHASATSSSSTATASSGRYCWWLEVLFGGRAAGWTHVDPIAGVVDDAQRVAARGRKKLAYVVGAESDHVKDVTARYAPSMLSAQFKTLRVDGDWWAAALRPFQNAHLDVEDRTEDTHLESEQATQKLPTTLSAYKNHELFAIEKHLGVTQTITPGARPVGFVKGHKVFERAAVCDLRSREQWLKTSARVVMDTQQPVKTRSVRRRSKSAASGGDGDGPDVETKEIQLFGEWQTRPFERSRVQDGQIPVNQHGNVELFHPAMLPIGAVHMADRPGIAKVARQLGVEYADAVVGFEFSSGRTVPKKNGIVVAEHAAPLLEEAWVATQQHKLQQQVEARQQRIVSLWERLVRRALIKADLDAREELAKRAASGVGTL